MVTENIRIPLWILDLAGKSLNPSIYYRRIGRNVKEKIVGTMFEKIDNARHDYIDCRTKTTWRGNILAI